ncbi:hypothetical protein [Geobacillus sp. YHL]|uniref:hypothetical protein n=1 Tax=Geobacillus sp. YHL TaxID=2796117 RepID=UPI001EF01A01|nr:hypothetical protein [Geobacillus sp. YHL]MCG6793839.1 hypothetical protein [Geobacillus sp. YHL]
MLKNEDYAHIEKAKPEQIKLALDFIETLYDEDLSGFWEMISEIDKSRIYGLFEANKHYDPKIDFLGFLNDIREEVRRFYDNVKEDMGISQSARYTHDGEVVIYLLENVKASRYYIAETLEKVYPVRLSLDVKFQDGSFVFSYGVRIYDDEFRKIKI